MSIRSSRSRCSVDLDDAKDAQVTAFHHSRNGKQPQFSQDAVDASQSLRTNAKVLAMQKDKH